MTDIISDLPLDDRPRERLFAHGARVLSDAELVAILLGCGTFGKNAMDLARELLSSGLARLGERDPVQTGRVYGMGNAKAARLAAAFEIARRLSREKQPLSRGTFDTDLAGAGLVSSMAKQRQERLGAYFLDSRDRILRQREIFVGSITHAAVSTREILHAALEENAVGMALYHNHPSGDPTPSPHDIEFTERLNTSLQFADIELLDHLVIGKHRYYSMKRKGLF